MNMRGYALGAVSVLLGVTSAIGVIKINESGAASDRWSIAREAPKSHSLRSPDNKYGQEAPVEVVFYPDAIESSGGREKIAYHAEVLSRHKNAGGAAWTVLVVDDLGQVVKEIDRVAGKIASRGIAITKSAWVDVPDGFYSVRARAAVHSDEGDDVGEAVQHIAVVRGRVREMPYDTWRLKSRDAIARSLPQGGTL
jgi:hypothetical protein